MFKNKYVNIIGLLILSSGFRFYNLGKNSLWMDEARQFKEYHFAKSLKHLIIRASGQQQPPLDYLIGSFVTQVFGVSEVTIRMSAFVFGSILPVLTYFLIRRLADSTVAICASMLIAVSPPLIQYSQEARPYSIYFFLLFLSILTFFKLIENQRIANWAAYFCVLVGLVFSRGFDPICYLTVLNIVILIWSFLTINDVFDFRFFMKHLSLCGIIACLYMPFFLLFQKKTKINALEYSGIADLIELIGVSIGNLVDSIKIITDPFFYVLILFFLIGIYHSFKQDRNPRWLIFVSISICLPFFHSFVFHFLASANYQFSTRYAVYTIPFVTIIATYGFIQLFRLKRIKQPANSVIFTLAFITVFALNIYQIFQYYKKEKTDYRGAAIYLKETMTNNDVVIRETFKEHGRWEPYIYGRGIYYKKLNQLPIEKVAKKIIDKPDSKGKVFFLLHEDIPEHKKLVFNERFVEKKFNGMRIISLKQSNGLLRMDFIELLQEMIKHYPENNSRFDLYMALAYMYKEIDQSVFELYRAKALHYKIPKS